MFLKNIYLSYFRNYIQEEVNFHSNKIIILGNNAQGKSNLLEAIELLSTLKSHRTSREQDFVYKDRVYGQIKANISRNFADYDLGIMLPFKGRRELTLNYEKLSRNLDFLGIVNTVLFSSLDIDLVRGSPEYRRNWVDNLLVQLEPIYSYIIKQYLQVLKQRNALLKSFKTRGIMTFSSLSKSEELELQLWDDKLVETGCRVMRRRGRVLSKIEPLAKLWHNQISNKTEKLQIIYLPNVEYKENEIEDIQNRIREEINHKRNAEISSGNTLVGPHRDDIDFMINQATAKNYGSQGQQRTLVLSLKLGELQLIEQVVGETPLLLLDDVMAELDLKRQQQLLDSLGNRFQTFITTTHLNYFDNKLLQQAQIIEVEKGKVII
ncbi:MAG: DNA replication/repair protein RecF [Cyanobacteria bacterium]|nr:DNA replication/repair protein RecF [Cyanobacteria bacterium CG_2015-16_32_12]NCO79214.1 DNA replication/repair protein RecF [Cyanobacteria bacterium CG_2015-22_32_23]NCQ03311.1 DNA replication/repair protein RecF [Cyanobacteria bacterium CG_2015-09_32_10]NCS85312.1 DNA replication/repair protein RecF [Cyanobacteria bacterium CG_2015-02_32_10]